MAPLKRRQRISAHRIQNGGGFRPWPLAAWAWWQSMSTEQETLQQSIVNSHANDDRESLCDDLLYNIDTPMCAVSKKRGKAAGADVERLPPQIFRIPSRHSNRSIAAFERVESLNQGIALNRNDLREFNLCTTTSDHFNRAEAKPAYELNSDFRSRDNALRYHALKKENSYPILS